MSSSKKGKILGTSQCRGTDELQELIVDDIGGFIDPLLNERLLGILSTKENVNLETLGFETNINNYSAVIVPIDIAEKRIRHAVYLPQPESLRYRRYHSV